jgi:hypothetical protein
MRLKNCCVGIENEIIALLNTKNEKNVFRKIKE